MLFTKVVSLLAACLYALGSFGTFWGLPAGRQRIKILGYLLTWAGFALHTLLVVGIVLLTPPEELSRGYFVQLLAWCVLLAYFVGWRLLKFSFLSMTAAPLALLLFILAHKVGASPIELPGAMRELFLLLHIGPLYASLGLLTLAFGAALLFLHLDRKLKAKAKLSEFDRELPALDTYDRLNRLAVVLGFPLYTLGLAAGFIWAPLTWGQEGGGWDPKEVFSLFVWFLYAAAFYLRILRGWRGRKAALLVLVIFGISVFSLLGVNFLLPTRHSFSALAAFTA